MVIGVFSAGFGLKGFLLPNKFIDGGATGISLLLENLTS
ncbi:MAG: YitT family protein, partial [Flavobacteriaceae bacterium]|nr:YitT family protein [Flavobacteriaceae bacterium]